jgi:predicted PurR-regulated permease PerM
MIDYILTACGIILLAVASYVLVPLIKKAGTALTDQIEEKTKSDKLAQGVRRASDVVEQVVVAITQTYVDDLKKSGSFDEDAQKQALQMAKEAAAALISSEVQQLISENYNNFTEWLLSAIEAAVAHSKWEAKK